MKNESAEDKAMREISVEFDSIRTGMIALLKVHAHAGVRPFSIMLGLAALIAEHAYSQPEQETALSDVHETIDNYYKQFTEMKKCPSLI